MVIELGVGSSTGLRQVEEAGLTAGVDLEAYAALVGPIGPDTRPIPILRNGVRSSPAAACDCRRPTT
jgi:hypothetical protein